MLAIDSGAFSGCINLRKVTISLNHYLTHISTEAFDKSIRQLKTLNLADNRLSSVSEVLVPWRKLEDLELSGNPWHCDRKLHFISAALNRLRNDNHIAANRKRRKLGAIVGKCASPSRQSGTPLHDFHFKKCKRRPQLLKDRDIEVTQFVSDTKQRLQHEKPFEVQNTATNKIVKNEDMDEEEAMKANDVTAIIVSACVVGIVLIMAVVSFAVFLLQI